MVRLALVVLAVALPACIDGSEADPSPLVVVSATEMGLVGAPETVLARDGGATVRSGTRLLWLFGDTLFNPPAEDGASGRTNTAALASVDEPRATTEPTDANGAPSQAIPFTDEELEFNEANAPVRVALWPSGAVPTDSGALAFTHAVIVRQGFLNYDNAGVELAEFAEDATTGTRIGSLFAADEPVFVSPMVHDGFVYLYGTREIGASAGIAVARVAQAEVREREAYQVWDGSAWVDDVSEAAAVFSDVPGSPTVAWNEALQHFVAVHSFGLSNRVVARTAPAPEGPWSEPIDLFTGMEPEQNFNYAGRQHPVLALDDGRTLFVSYYRPLGPGQGTLRLVRVELE